MEDQEPRMDLPPSITARPSPAWSQALPVAEVESELVALVARAKRGDREAYTLLYRRYLDDVYRFALGRLGNREAAEDAVQNIFVRALTALPSCHENAAFAGWLFAIARNVVTDQLRTRRHETDPIPDDALWTDTAPGPEEIALHGEARRFLLAARDKCLSAGERDLFDLLLTELNDKQIAVALGCSHGAVRTAHWRLLSKLRACLGPLGGSPLRGSAHA
jgi:RNA polymerase sigma-70 factor (ECF subfamily)